MPKILVVSPHFPPVNTADMQRVRMVLPFFKENGWQAEVLAVPQEQVSAPRDSWLVEGLPKDVPVHRVEVMGLAWVHIPGLGNLGLRSLRALAKAGDLLLEKGGFDLVYFSTTVFEVHILGPRWKRKFGVPFVMDYQDPWVNDYYREHPEIMPPGGRLKYALSNALQRWAEPRVLRECAGITSVSPEYPKQLARRYSWLQDLPHLVEPFCGSKSDFRRLGESSVHQEHFNPRDGLVHWVYVGAMVPMMEVPLRGFFTALKSAGASELLQKLKLHFIGTSYARPGAALPKVKAIAAEFGLADCVDELSDRIPYSEALQCLTEADALLAFGTDDAGYTASKVYPYLLAGRPMLAIFHEDSPVVSLIDRVSGAVCVSFNPYEDLAHLAERIANQWLRNRDYARPLVLNEEAFRPYTDSESARKLSTFFNKCLGFYDG